MPVYFDTFDSILMYIFKSYYRYNFRLFKCYKAGFFFEYLFSVFFIVQVIKSIVDRVTDTEEVK